MASVPIRRLRPEDIRPFRLGRDAPTASQGIRQGGTEVARALGQLGTTLQKAGAQVADYGEAAQATNDRNIFNRHILDYKQGLSHLLNGNPDAAEPTQGFRELTRQNAVDGESQLNTDVNSLRKSIGSQITDPAMLQAWEQESSALALRTAQLGRTHAITERRLTTKDNFNAALRTSIDETTLDITSLFETTPDLIVINAHLANMVQDHVEVVQRGLDEEGTIDPTTRKVQLQIQVAALHAAVSAGLLSKLNTDAARKHLEMAISRKELTPEVADKIRNKIRTVDGTKLVQVAQQVKNVTAILDQGGEVNPETLRVLHETVAASGGSRASVLKDTLEEAIQHNAAIRTFNNQSISGQTNLMRQAKATLEAASDDLPVEMAAEFADPDRQQAALIAASPENKLRVAASTARLLEKYEQNFAYTNREITAGRGLSLAVQYGIIPSLTPFDMTSLEMYGSRARQAQQATESFGVFIPPLLPHEIQGLNDAIMGEPVAGKILIPNEIVKVLSAMTQGLGRDNAEMIGSIAVKDNAGIAVAMMKAANDQDQLARKIIIGIRAMEANPELIPSKEIVNNVATKVLGDVFLPETAAARGHFIAAAKALAVADIIDQGSDDATDIFKVALESVTGGVLDVNGQKILAPVPGAQLETVEAAFAALVANPAWLVQYGNGKPVYSDGSNFTAEALHEVLRRGGPDAQLVSAGPGKYHIVIPGASEGRGPLGFVQAEDTGEAYMLDLRALIESGKAVVPEGHAERLHRLELEHQRVLREEFPGGADTSVVANLTAQVLQTQIDDAENDGNISLAKRLAESLAFLKPEVKPEVAPTEHPDEEMEVTVAKVKSELKLGFVTTSKKDKLKIANIPVTALHTRARGQPAVEEAIDIVDGLFPLAKTFLLRVAAVESEFGAHRNTFRIRDKRGGSLGIWQTDRNSGFPATKDVKSHPGLRRAHKKIENELGIDWMKVEFEDLSRPLISALAARLVLLTKVDDIPPDNDIVAQAQYWKTHYNTARGKGRPQRVIDVITDLGL